MRIISNNNNYRILSNKYIKKSKTSINQLKIFLSYVNQKALEEYLYIFNVYRVKKKLTPNELINLITNGNNANDNNNYKELTMDEVNNILVDTQA